MLAPGKPKSLQIGISVQYFAWHRITQNAMQSIRKNYVYKDLELVSVLMRSPENLKK